MKVTAPLSLLTSFLWERWEGQEQTKFAREFLANSTAGRTLEPSEVAKLFLFLASDDAKMVSGSNYRMDGGMLLH